MDSLRFTLVFVITIVSSHSQVLADTPLLSYSYSSPFSSALDTLQSQLNYTFKSISLLRRAVTHASFSEESNRALTVLGTHAIETSVSLLSLKTDIDISAKDLNKKLSEISKVETSCAVDGKRLSLQKIVRVSPKTNSSAPAVVCGTYRAIIGAIAIDAGNINDAGNVFWNVHHGKVGLGRAYSL
ncbi:hypothetical protein ACFE04_018857 [Oxalis oulophora]